MFLKYLKQPLLISFYWCPFFPHFVLGFVIRAPIMPFLRNTFFFCVKIVSAFQYRYSLPLWFVSVRWIYFLLKCHTLCPICLTFLVVHLCGHIYVVNLNLWSLYLCRPPWPRQLWAAPVSAILSHLTEIIKKWIHATENQNRQNQYQANI